MPVEWIEHKGRQVLVCDYQGMGPEAVLKNLELAVEKIQETPPPTRILFLSIFEGAVADTKVMAHFKKIGQISEPRTEKSAIVGIHGIRHILLSAYNRVTGAGEVQKLFDNTDEALDWLVS